ncbi:hypothetical protein IWQ60_010016 [Tieghemiomyces parasiticus]|uniref:Ubiquitin-like protease family profile domain-containing protein n=1 Tax=Tieghemiomyces parasiticus TaxID=78921 RepID=A0A9W7ZRI6_9FUNG|nr:hypothetical protein IWQ60_010016 [Tieghemiomyces parasiticus]
MTDANPLTSADVPGAFPRQPTPAHTPASGSSMTAQGNSYLDTALHWIVSLADRLYTSFRPVLLTSSTDPPPVRPDNIQATALPSQTVPHPAPLSTDPSSSLRFPTPRARPNHCLDRKYGSMPRDQAFRRILLTPSRLRLPSTHSTTPTRPAQHHLTPKATMDRLSPYTLRLPELPTFHTTSPDSLLLAPKTTASLSECLSDAPAETWLEALTGYAKQVLRPAPERPAAPAYRVLKAREADLDVELDRRRATARNNFPTLPEDALAVISRALKANLVLEMFNIPISGSDLRTLTRGQWLNDEVINFYMNLIVARSKATLALPTVHAFNTFFYAKLDQDGYAKVRRWSKKNDIFAKDLIVIPVHLPGHWTCAVVNFRNRRIEYYDSMLGDNSRAFQVIRDYLTAEHQDKKQTPFDLSGWTDWCPKDIPRQQNGYDCGVFTCIFAEYCSRAEPFDFDQTHMADLRQRMMYEIATGQLLLLG